MAHTAEDMVTLLKSNPSPFSLAGDMPIFSQGIADLVARVQALEADNKARNTPAAPAPDQT